MKISIGYAEGIYDLVLYSTVGGYALDDTRQVEVSTSENGTVWFNLRGKKKPKFTLDFEEFEKAISTSEFKKIQELTIPDYLLPVWVKIENANITDKYTIQTEYEGLAYVHLTSKNVGTVPTIREFRINVYAQ